MPQPVNARILADLVCRPTRFCARDVMGGGKDLSGPSRDMALCLPMVSLAVGARAEMGVLSQMDFRVSSNVLALSASTSTSTSALVHVSAASKELTCPIRLYDRFHDARMQSSDTIMCLLGLTLPPTAARSPCLDSAALASDAYSI